MVNKLHLIGMLLGAAVSSGCVSAPADTPAERNKLASLELARQMVGQGEYQRAVKFLLPRSREDDAPSEVHMLLGLSFLGLNNPETAMKSFAHVVNLDPSNDDAKLNLSYTQILLNKNVAARETLGQILKRGKYPFPEKVRLNIGLSFMQEKRCEKAMTEFKAALDIDPTYPAPYFNIGKCHLSAGKLGDAKNSFQRAADFCPGCLEPQMELAVISHRLGDKKKALGHIESILKAKPDALIEQRAQSLRQKLLR